MYGAVHGRWLAYAIKACAKRCTVLNVCQFTKNLAGRFGTHKLDVQFCCNRSSRVLLASLLFRVQAVCFCFLQGLQANHHRPGNRFQMAHCGIYEDIIFLNALNSNLRPHRSIANSSRSASRDQHSSECDSGGRLTFVHNISHFIAETRL